MNNDFNFTVAICPNNINLDREMAYIKSALLYADSVSLISPIAYLYFQLTDERNQNNERAALQLIKKVMPFCQSADPILCQQYEPVIKEFEKILLGKKYKSIPMVLKLQIKRELKKFAVGINDVLKQNIGNNVCEDISLLVKQKKVKIQEFDHSLADADGCILEFFQKLKTSISHAYPLFDEQSNNLMGAATKTGIIDMSKVDKYKATHAGVADRILTRLPSFEYSTIDEILDIRKELTEPLVRFRSKMLRYTDNIQSLPWDKSFESECYLLYDKEIAPAILEIDELTRDNSFIKNLGIKVLTDESIWQNIGGLVISIAAAGAIASFSDAIATDAAILTTGGTWAASKIANTFNEYRKNIKDINRKDLYFYYKAGKRMSRM